MEATDFYHAPVLLSETIDALQVRPEGTYVDATFGGGGHAAAILAQLSENGRLIVFDRDLAAYANVPPDDRVLFLHSNFKYVRQMLRVEGITEVDGILADLGVSSHQFDTADRGFSFRMEGPLDMRMNNEGPVTAADIVRTYPEEKLVKLFSEYGEVRNAKTLVRQIITARGSNSLQSINDFLHIIQPVIMGSKPRYLAQVFQALRIEVNEEMDSLRQFLAQSSEVLKSGGVMAVITFHSLEDRIVKNFFKTGNSEGIADQDKFGRVKRTFELINKKPIEATEVEVRRNSRARSAKLRAARKL
ncbi:MAG TPA: 16S rRNA (cytosine(1402)-N(4))-methyltransferase RsmH [Saprospiraceae bacterium]|nr:16S rRNA (cytosine(1402)-N(4))-methyltransferase RsmH [Saprospiraceae bacterium]HQW56852.1 16S rRNA (cytosine(1402)-N(4))-methyltransferase RsmH [Saprospiraceae bacterium]